MPELIGYARVSTVDQDTALQLDALKRAGCERIFAEKVSAGAKDRPELERALAYARKGDTLIVWRLDRLARSLPALVQMVAELERRGVGLLSLQEGLNLHDSTPGGRLMFHVFAALAEFERGLTRARTREGLAAARARGRRGGRPTVMTPAKLGAARTMRGQGNTLGEIARALGVSKSAVGRALASWEEAKAAAALTEAMLDDSTDSR